MLIYCKSANRRGCKAPVCVLCNHIGWAGFHQVVPAVNQDLSSWWRQCRASIRGAAQRRLNSLLMLVTWNIWRERNGRIFGNNYKPIQQVIDQIKSKARLWTIASRGRLLIPIVVRT
jgi:hypothetical protein